MIPWAALAMALGLGLQTSISPCPLASNIAAISFIGRRVESAPHVLISGLLYTLGRTIAYVGLGVILLAGLLTESSTSLFLQKYLNQLLGPILILAGMMLLGLLQIGSFSLVGSALQQCASRGGLIWAILLGLLFALSFCPVSAALFFGALIPLSATHHSRFALPILYGVGTALPVLGFALLMAFASRSVGWAFSRLAQVERGIRWLTGIVFIVVGFYYCLVYIYGLPIFSPATMPAT